MDLNHNDRNEFNEQNEVPPIENNGNQMQQMHQMPVQKKKKSTNWLSMLSAAIVGSMLTIAATPITNEYITPLFSDEDGESIVNIAATENEDHETESFVDIQKTNEITTDITKMVEEASKAIVGVVNVQSRSPFFINGEAQSVESGTGSGVVFKKTDDSAYIVTNYHVIENANQLEVSLHNGEKVMAEVVGADPLTDLAVLEIDAELVSSVLSFGDSTNVKPGEPVIAIGNPLGLEFSRTVTQGIISGKERTIQVDTPEGKWDLDVIQTDAAINPGNSGGALLNTQGQVIGINSLKISQNGVEGLGFAIPSNDVVPIINELIQHGEIKRPYIGVSLIDVNEIPMYYRENTSIKTDSGTVVAKVDITSAAAKAGLQVEDVIVGINGVEVEDASDLRKYLYTEVEIGDKVQLKINRSGKMETVTVTLTE